MSTDGLSPESLGQPWLSEVPRYPAPLEQSNASGFGGTRPQDEDAPELLRDVRLWDRVGEAMRADGYVGDLRPPLLAYIAMTSRLLRRPLNLVFVGPSGGGKNKAVDAAKRLIPTDAVFVVTAASPKALIHSDQDFRHRVLVMSEADSIPDDGAAASAIRALASEGVLAYDVSEQDAATNRWRTRRIQREGPTSLITTSIRSLSPQLGTRILEVQISDEPEQTREIMRAHARASSGVADQIAFDVRPLVAAQEWLQAEGKRNVRIPFAQALAELAPATHIRMRRDFRQVLATIEAVTVLHQCQRDLAGDAIVATPDDYRIARELLAPVLDTTAADGVSPIIRETVHAINTGEVITEAELAARLGLSKSTVSRRVGKAIEGGYLANLELRRGVPAMLRRGAPLPEEVEALPTVDQIARHVTET